MVGQEKMKISELIGALILLGLAQAVAEGACALISRIRRTDAITKEWHVAVYLSTYSLAILGTLLLVFWEGPKSFWMFLYFVGMFVAFFGLLSVVPRVTGLILRRSHPGLRGFVTGVLFLGSYVGAVILLGKLLADQM